MNRFLAALAAALAEALLLAAPAAAGPEGEWPAEAYGLPLTRPDWVLVVPAMRGTDGAVRPWERDGAWAKEWIVPRATPGGVRTVSALGDSEDVRTVAGSALDAMDAASLRGLAKKYSAPAIAVAIQDESGAVAVAGWIDGEGASWLAGDPSMPRESVLASIDQIFGGGPGEGRPVDDFDVAITGQRDSGGRTEYRLEADPVILEMLEAVDGLETYPLDAGSVVAWMSDGRGIEEALRSAGVAIMRP